MPTRGTIELCYKFFDKFERQQLAFLYQEKTKSGDDSR